MPARPRRKQAAPSPQKLAATVDRGIELIVLCREYLEQYEQRLHRCLGLSDRDSIEAANTIVARLNAVCNAMFSAKKSSEVLAMLPEIARETARVQRRGAASALVTGRLLRASRERVENGEQVTTLTESEHADEEPVDLALWGTNRAEPKLLTRIDGNDVVKGKLREIAALIYEDPDIERLPKGVGLLLGEAAIELGLFEGRSGMSAVDKLNQGRKRLPPAR